MKDTDSLSKLVKSKRKHELSEISESSESESGSVPVVKYSKENVSDDSESDDSSQEEARKVKKRKHHHHHHHHHHRRKHKLKEGERLRYDDGRERYDEHSSLRHPHSSHRRHGEDRIRVKNEETSQYSKSTSRHRQHRDDSADRIRHHRKRDGESRQRRDESSRVKKPSTEREERDQANSRRERRGDVRDFRERGPRNGEQNSIPANRPIKQERVSPEGEDYQWGKKSESTENAKGPPVDKAKPNFGLSGKLAEETNTFNGVVLKYSEPQEARKPKRRWRFYPFKGDAGLPTLYLHRQSCYLIGRDRKVADIPVDHPSCSKQHAALQYRLVPYQRDDGSTGRRVRPYIIDLESANGTYVNNNKIESKKYIELLEKDVIKFGYSSREYVLLHEQSKDDALDDDIAANVE